MHWVDRGPEPEGLSDISARYTPGWVRYYEEGNRKKPSDSKWREYHEPLSKSFYNLCGYCEEKCKGEVDHFRPKSRFPERVYQWSNWIFSCHDCNHAKLDKWFAMGYVDPCAETRAEHPENYFEFDVTTGEILPRQGLTARREEKSWRMIDDLHLNAHHHLKARTEWIEVLSGVISENSSHNENVRAFCNLVASIKTRLSSVARALLVQRGYEFDNT